MYEYRVVPGEPIPLGRRYEHLARRIIFDITEWVETFGSGVVMLLHQRQGDEIPYPVTVLRTNADMATPNHTSGVLVLWDVTNVDTEKKCQYGSAELRYYATGSEETLVKSELYRTIVTNAMGSEIADAPESQPEWLATLLDAAGNISAAQPAAEAALSAVSDAQAAASDAQAAQSNAADAANTATAAALAARSAQSDAEAALSHISVSVSGDGNAVTGLSYDAETNEFTAAKAATFLTEHQDISGKVDKINGKGLSTEDYTTAEKSKLSGIEDNAEENVIDRITVNNTAVSVANKTAALTVPTKVSDLTNDSGFLTEHQNLADYATKSELPTKTSDLTNDSGFITKAVNDLTNYYLKAETYTQAEINALISAIPKLDIQVVSSLPASNISTETIYLATTGDESQNLYTEYIYVNNAWEKLGTQTLDLSGYVPATRTVAGHALSADVTITKSDVGLGNVDNTSDANKPISTATQTALNAKVDKDGAKVLSDNNYTTAEKNKLAGIPSDATNNAGTITGITMNGASKGTSGVVNLGTVLTEHQDISGKVDKVTGKGLSTNDYTDADKAIVAAALTQHQDISGKVDKVTGKGLSTEDYTTAEKSKLSGIPADANHTTIDATLSNAGQAADAKASGDAFAALRDYIASMEVYRNASGNPATFDDGAAANLKAISVTITPTQSGSGDPSPSNIRPISGVSSVTVTRTGENGANSQSVTVSLVDSNNNPLTVYRGTLDVTEGTLTVTHAAVDLGTLSWVKGNGYFASSSLAVAIKLPASDNVAADALCSHYPIIPFGTLYWTVSSFGMSVQYAPSSGFIAIRDNSKADYSVEDFVETISGATFVYPLKTPATHSLTPQQLAALVGYNSLSANAGSVIVTYKADTALGPFGGAI